MKQRRGYLVVGPESSGTRLMTQLLVNTGCFGDWTHDQRLDAEDWPPLDDVPLLVWRRSLPHRGEWPDLYAIIKKVRAAHYEVLTLVMSRDWHSMAISQQMAPHVPDVTQALANISVAYLRIFDALGDTGCGFEVVNYEALVARPRQTFDYLARRIGLGEVDTQVEVYDGNARYYR